MYCKKCGNQLSGNSGRCQRCGEVYNNDAADNNKLKKIIIIALVAVILCLSVVAVDVIKDRFSKDTDAVIEDVFINETNEETVGKDYTDKKTEPHEVTSGEEMTFSVEEVDTGEEGYNYKGVLTCKSGNNVIWTYESESTVKTELDLISDAYVDDDKVYFIVGGRFIAIDKNSGKERWSVENVGGSNKVLFDDKYIYVSGYYGPNLLVMSKQGKVLYMEDNPDYGWVYDMGFTSWANDELVIHYANPYEGVVRKDVATIVELGDVTNTRSHKESFGTPVFDEVVASATWADDGNITFDAKNLIDGNPETAWAVSKKNNSYPELTFYAKSPQKIKNIQILNGFCLSEKLYGENNRVDSVRIVFSDGTIVEKNLEDKFGEYSYIECEPPVVCDEFTMTLYSGYDGSKYNDTCVSEIVIN